MIFATSIRCTEYAGHQGKLASLSEVYIAGEPYTIGCDGH